MKSKQVHVSEGKIKVVKELSDLLKSKKTILIASIKRLPASQFQEIKKKLRGKAVIKVPKKNLFFRAIDDLNEENLKKLKDYYEDSSAILFSDLDSFDLAGELIKSKSPSKAKAGQEAPMDILVEAGPTDLPPGPAISELGAVGLQVQIDKGKITIKESKVIVNEGKKISQAAADIMAKLDIKPFSIGFIPLSAYDNDKKILYIEIKIDKEKAIKSLNESFAKSLAFAVEIGHACPETISFLLGKAGRHEKAIENLLGKEKKEEPVEEKAEEVSEEQTQTPEVKSEGGEK